MFKYVGNKLFLRNLLFRNICKAHVNSITIKKQEPIVIVEKKPLLFQQLIDLHKSQKIPFTDDELYKNLLEAVKAVNNIDITSEGWHILEHYTKLNIDNIENEFFTEIIKEFARVKYMDFEFWYRAEKRIIKNLNNFTNNQVAIFVNSFGLSDRGSNYLFERFTNEILNRKIGSFTKEEFVMIYHGFKQNNIKDKLLWAILNRANIELFDNVAI